MWDINSFKKVSWQSQYVSLGTVSNYSHLFFFKSFRIWQNSRFLQFWGLWQFFTPQIYNLVVNLFFHFQSYKLIKYYFIHTFFEIRGFYLPKIVKHKFQWVIHFHFSPYSLVSWEWLLCSHFIICMSLFVENKNHYIS